MAAIGRVTRRLTRTAGRRASYREGAAFGALTFGSVAVTALISSVVNSRLYGVDVIGEYALALGAVSAVRLLSTAKERPALVRELTNLEPRHPRVTGLFVATLTFSAVLTSVVGAAAIAVCSLLLSGPIARPSLFLPLAANVLGYALISNTSENMDVLVSAFRAGRQLFWVRLFDSLLFIAVAVALSGPLPTVWGLIIAWNAAQAIGLLHRLVRTTRFMRLRVPRAVIRSGFSTLPGLIRFGLKIAPGAVADGGSNESGTWLVASFSSIGYVGAYGRAYLLIKQLMVVNVYTCEMLFPTLVERRAKGDGVGFARALVDSLRYTTLSLFMVGAGAAGVTAGIMRVFGSGFGRGATALSILLVVPALASLSLVQRFALLALGNPWMASVCGLLRFGVTIGSGIVLTWKLGAAGAALALVIGFLIDLFVASRFIIPRLETRLTELWPARQQIALIAGAAAGYLVSRAVYGGLGYPLGIFAGAPAGAVAFLALVVLGGGINERDRERYADIRRGIANRRSGQRAEQRSGGAERAIPPGDVPEPARADGLGRAVSVEVARQAVRATPFRCSECGYGLRVVDSGDGMECPHCGWYAELNTEWIPIIEAPTESIT